VRLWNLHFHERVGIRKPLPSGAGRLSSCHAQPTLIQPQEAGQADSVYHVRVLEDALQLAEQAGREQDALRREALIGECMQLWRIAHRLKDRNRKARGFPAQALTQYDREA